MSCVIPYLSDLNVNNLGHFKSPWPKNYTYAALTWGFEAIFFLFQTSVFHH